MSKRQMRRFTGGQPAPRARDKARLRLEHLEARDVPATTLVSTLPGGGAIPQGANLLDVDTTGNFILFTSGAEASTLVPGATDASTGSNLYWRDLQTNTTKLISVYAGTNQAIDNTFGDVKLSRNGQFVVFDTNINANLLDSTLAAGSDNNFTTDVFEWSAASGATKLASVITQGASAGKAVGFAALGTGAFSPDVSADGKFVTYLTGLNANNLDPSIPAANDDVASIDIFRRDMTVAPDASTLLVSQKNNSTETVGKQGGGTISVTTGRYLSEDGRFVTYWTSTSAASIDATWTDNNFNNDVFLRDMSVPGGAGNNGTKLVSAIATDAKSTPGDFAAPPGVVFQSTNSSNAIIAGGTDTVLFTSNASGGAAKNELVAGYVNPQGPNRGSPNELYVRTNASFANGTAATQLVTAAAGTTNKGGLGNFNDQQITPNGKFVVFQYGGNDLVSGVTDNNGTTDVFEYDVAAATNTLVSVDSTGKATDPNFGSFLSNDRQAVSDDGRFVVFTSSSNTLTAVGLNPQNFNEAAWVRDTKAGVTQLVSAVANSGAAADVNDARIAGDGSSVFFTAFSRNVVNPPLTVNGPQIYKFDLKAALAATPAGQLVQSTFPVGSPTLAVAPSGSGTVNLYTLDQTTGKMTQTGSVSPFPGFTGEIRVAVGDVNGDGTPDVIAGQGAPTVAPGQAAVAGQGNSVVVVSGSDGSVIRSITPYEAGFTGGVFVASGDFNGDGFADIVVSPDQGGGGRIRVFDGKTGAVLADFLGIDDPNFRGGARIGVGDVNGDGTPDIVVGAGFGGGPRVAIFDGKSIVTNGANPTKLVGDFFAFESTLRNGVFVSVGDVNGDGKADLVLGGGPGGAPRVFVVSGADLISSGGSTLTPLANFFAGDVNSRGGARVAAKDVDHDGLADVVVGSGDKTAASAIVYTGAAIKAAGANATPAVLDTLNFPGLANGAYVG